MRRAAHTRITHARGQCHAPSALHTPIKRELMNVRISWQFKKQARLKLACAYLTKAEARGLAHALQELPHVEDVRVAPANTTVYLLSLIHI